MTAAAAGSGPDGPPFHTVLIANRGEIAVRVIRTCRELGIRTVVVHSTADRASPAVRLADETVQIGPPPARHSYLNAAAIVAAAHRTGAQAIHPGYGFLSEDPDFAEICETHGLVFVGPPAAVLAKLGDKAATRRAAVAAGLPVLPGSQQTVASATAARELADRIGFPLLIKAAAGGGGRGMTAVRDPREFRRAFQETSACAQALFGDGRVYLEKLLEGARHVEVQVLADQHGSVVHLGERDCSVQRRRQKLLEETPAPRLDPERAARMGEAAVRAARQVRYVGAGTFEFLVAPEGEYYLMEVNGRIQVEHPVTELVTGIDLVRAQLQMAAGRPLGLRQADVVCRGAAIQARVNVEDPDRDFRPAPGLLTGFSPPDGPFTRTDTYGEPGLRVPPDYDPLLAKVAVWAPDREQAISRLDRALAEFHVTGPGIRTTIGFLRTVLANPVFREARHTTSVVDQMLAGPGSAGGADRSGGEHQAELAQ